MARVAKEKSTRQGSQPTEAHDNTASYIIIPGADEHEASWKMEAGQSFVLQASQDIAGGRLLED